MLYHSMGGKEPCPPCYAQVGCLKSLEMYMLKLDPGRPCFVREDVERITLF